MEETVDQHTEHQQWESWLGFSGMNSGVKNLSSLPGEIELCPDRSIGDDTLGGCVQSAAGSRRMELVSCLALAAMWKPLLIFNQSSFCRGDENQTEGVVFKDFCWKS